LEEEGYGFEGCGKKCRLFGWEDVEWIEGVMREVREDNLGLVDGVVSVVCGEGWRVEIGDRWESECGGRIMPGL
ncbi:hypothetical protein, partial [Paenibacillus xylanexedens]|uniref:hypothetical protein n=1 Tax=Paenibacillus xylanexedens TaxID=528191 RepID=UPI001C92F779